MTKWIFGYGSLMWFPNFPYLRKVKSYIPGWKRRFWQGSTDHRGVPGKPGRVLSLLEETCHKEHPKEVHFPTDSKCWGITFEVSDDKYDEIVEYLDFREKCGYSRVHVLVYDANGEILTENALTYIPSPDNDEFLGPATLKETALHIIHSVGPSGRNIEYLLKCAHSFRLLEIEDDYIYALEEEAIKHLNDTDRSLHREISNTKLAC